MSLHPVEAVDHALDEYADYFRTEFRDEGRALRQPPMRRTVQLPSERSQG